MTLPKSFLLSGCSYGEKCCARTKETKVLPQTFTAAKIQRWGRNSVGPLSKSLCPPFIVQPRIYSASLQISEQTARAGQQDSADVDSMADRTAWTRTVPLISALMKRRPTLVRAQRGTRRRVVLGSFVERQRQVVQNSWLSLSGTERPDPTPPHPPSICCSNLTLFVQTARWFCPVG